MKAPWVTYRPEIRVMDCTVRDGGLINDHRFEDGFVRAVYDTCVAAGIDAMEIGYKASDRLFARDAFGAWKFCREDDLRRVVGDNPSALRLSAMADAGGKTDWKTDILPKDQSVLDIIRVACYINQIPEAVEMIKDAHDKGYTTTCNIMAISQVQETELDQALDVLAQTPVDVVVVVDSFGALHSEQVQLLVRKFLAAVKPAGKEVGIHAHNNLQLGFANTIEAIIQGANRIDATMAGLGRGAGNCPMELLLGFLRNPKFKIRPVWQLIEEQMIPLRNRIEWGPLPAYIITGQLNQHPRAAINWRAGDRRDHCAEFYDRCISDV
ncbi:MAG TPA: aldolase catalytic domain-containing protein [Candidatus Sumerlaeota bacterium]|nr:MAG: 4-hydroxy-2-oxovalerate aldolase [candidate division BRC1 bacterium ADurb.BinA292]HPK01412.1 aldolase catalytic domain-containing protein [Candidatus Sumerlaeota bacterium]